MPAAPRRSASLHSGPNDELDLYLYRQHLRSPLLDAGRGAGRLLVPPREEGFDVDGCDASADMIDRADRGEISLGSRIDAVDQDDRCVHFTIRAETSDGRREQHTLTMRQ